MVQDIELPITGMTCTGCAHTIEKQLAGTQGVAEAHVSFASRTATVQFDPEKTDAAQLAGLIRGLGYEVPEEAVAPSLEDESGALIRRLWLGALFAIPAMVLGMAERLPWVQFTLALPVLLYSGFPFYAAAFKAARSGSVNMNTLISIGTLAGFGYSVYSLLSGGHHTYFEAAPVIIVLVLLGRFLELQARSKASDAIDRLAKLQPPVARVVRDGVEQEIRVAEVVPGDILAVRPGERIAVDGTIVDGASEIDEAMLTGESLPVAKNKGYNVSAGTRNIAGAFRFRATRTGKATALAQIADMVRKAQASKAPVARVADAVSGRFTWAILAIALVTFVVWLFFAPAGRALEMAVAVLIVACPCAMGLATPAALIAGTGRAAGEGVLFRNGEAMETAARVDTVVFDKTGTLTSGTPKVVSIAVERGFTEEGALEMAAAVEQWSEHPFAKAILERHGSRSLKPVEGFRAIPGTGAEGWVDGQSVYVGRSSQGHVELRVEGLRVATFAMADQLRPGTAAAVDSLRKAGLDVWLMSGDRAEVAQAVAREVGIEPDRVLAGVMPGEKAETITKLRAQNKRVAMVGDGVNDAPALAAANVGIAIGTGTDVAIESAGMILMKSDPAQVALALGLARRTLRVIHQNLFWAFGYNTLAIPVAAGLLYPWTGWTISPMLASAAMAMSSISVVLNSLRLRQA